MITIYTWSDGTELYHHGILGQKWGVRRYQNPDGSLTPAGKNRYASNNESNNSSEKKKILSDKQKKALIIGGSLVAAGLAAYGAYKLSDKIVTEREMMGEAIANDFFSEHRALASQRLIKDTDGKWTLSTGFDMKGNDYWYHVDKFESKPSSGMMSTRYKTAQMLAEKSDRRTREMADELKKDYLDSSPLSYKIAKKIVRR